MSKEIKSDKKMLWLPYIVATLDPSGTLPISIVPDENGEPSYELLVWGSEDVPKPTKQEFLSAVQKAQSMNYQTERRMAYPSIVEQLDLIFHGGIDEWREQIQSIKDQFPKP